MEWLLEHIHVYAGTPWWISIILTTAAVRFIMFKAYMGASDNGARMAAIRPISEPLSKKMRAAAAIPGNTSEVLALRQQMQSINNRAGIKIWKSFVPMITIFSGFGLWKLLRGMSALPVPGLETGGILWFTNLTNPDPYLLMPIVTSVVLHWVFRVRAKLPATQLLVIETNPP
jgi:YidC/Oxa1 family membrane protein insertase